MALSGSFLSSGWTSESGDVASLQLVWSGTQSVANNTTTISWTLKGHRTKASSYIKAGNFKVVIDGATVYSTTKAESDRIELRNGTIIASGTKTLTHTGNGSRSFKAYIEGGLYYYDVNCTGEKTFDLDTIPRASAITSAGNVTLGDNCKVVWTPLASSFRYKLKFSLGSWNYTTGVIHPNTTSPYTYSGYPIPLEVAYQILEGYTGKMTVTLYTFSDSGATNQIGSADPETFTVTVPSTTKPTVSMWLSPVHSLPEAFAGLYVQGLTKVKADIIAETDFNAVIRYCDMTVEGKTYGADDDYTSGYLTNPGKVSVTGHAVDSRSYGGYVKGEITVIDYAKPKIQNVTAKRCDENGEPTDSGTYLKITATRNYYKVESDGVQKNFCSIRYRYKTESAPYYSDWETILAADNLSSDKVETAPLLGGNLLATTTYRVEVQVVDDIGNTATSEIVVPTDKVYWHRDGAKNALGLGKYNERENAIDSAWDFYMNGHMVTGLPTPVDDTDAVPLGFLRDYIVEQGTSGIWTYRKWNSGIAECRGIYVQENVEVTEAWGSLFESVGYNVALPAGLFVKTPQFNITLVGSRGAMLEIYSEGSNTHTPNMSAVRPNSATLEILNTSIVAYGRWK